MPKLFSCCLLLVGFALSHLGAQTDSFLVKPYLQYATQDGIYVLWETTSPTRAVVEYGRALELASEPNLSQRIVVDTPKTLHEAAISDLATGTKYLYRVRSTTADGQEFVSPVYTFNTAVEDDSAFFFAFIGDTQENPRTPWAWGKVAQRIWEDRPNFIVHAGDIVDAGTRKTDWTEQFFPNGHVVMSRYPMYTVLGNHEQDAQYYYDYMVNPAPEYYYTFRYGNAQFFMIDTNRDVFPGSEQYDWLEWALAQSDATWKFVVHHHPPYSSEENDHGDTYIGASTYQTQARNLVPLYEAYGVDFCLFGHTHLYERTWPIFRNAVNQQHGVIYINSGGAGGGLEDFDPVRSWFTQELQVTHHYCTFAIFDKTVSFRAIDHDGRLFDSFQMTKDGETGTSLITLPPAPHFEIEDAVFQTSTPARLIPFAPDHQLVYTLDGSEPTLQSARYEDPLTIDQSCTLKARAYTADGRAGRVVSREFRRMEPRPARSVRNTQPGLAYAYYESEDRWNYLPDFTPLTPTRTGTVTSVNESEVDHRDNRFGLLLTGFVDLPRTDTYTFYTRSDDGSRLYIDGELVVDNDGNHGAFFAYGATILAAGQHQIRIEYFESSGTEMLRAGIVDDALGKMPFHPRQLSHTPQ
ncbi:MAG: metallophosphoesterase [Lewinella sp.]|nr:metallophosphoesterase [Lewinella sp.]